MNMTRRRARLAVVREIGDVRCGDCELYPCVCTDHGGYDDTAWLRGLADHDPAHERRAV